MVRPTALNRIIGVRIPASQPFFCPPTDSFPSGSGHRDHQTFLTPIPSPLQYLLVDPIINLWKNIVPAFNFSQPFFLNRIGR